MIKIYYKDPRDSYDADRVAAWCQANDIQVHGYYVDANDDATKLAEKYNLTVFPVIFSWSLSTTGVEQFAKYAEGVDAILSLSPEAIAEIRANVIPMIDPVSDPTYTLNS